MFLDYYLFKILNLKMKKNNVLQKKSIGQFYAVYWLKKLQLLKKSPNVDE